MSRAARRQLALENRRRYVPLLVDAFRDATASGAAGDELGVLVFLTAADLEPLLHAELPLELHERFVLAARRAP